MTNVLIGIDIGTTGVKAVAVDTEHGVIASATHPSVLSSPHPGWAEADPAAWLRTVEAALTELSVSLAGREVAAIATTGMVPAVVAVDGRGVPLRPSMLQNDARASREVAHLADTLGQADVLAQTGSAISQQSVAPKALWLQQHEPELWGRTAALVGSYDWVLAQLGAPLHVERNWALESGMYRIDGGVSDTVVDAVPGLDRVLAPVVEPGTVVGHLSAGVAERVGLRAGTPLVAGGADHVLSAYSAGLTGIGDWLVKLGGAGDILAVTDHPVVDERFFIDLHPVPGLWLPNGCMATSGSLVRWVQHLLGIDDLAAMDAQAASRPAAELLCLPYFLGEKTPRNDPDLRGIIAGLHLGHGPADIYRSALEGIAFGFRHNAEVLRSCGVELGEATITNGGATSLLWKQIHANVLGVPLRTVPGHPGASLGAAFAAGVGVGAFKTWSHPLALVQAGPVVDPDPALVGRYDHAYALWRELGDLTAGTMTAMARREMN